MSNLDLWNKVSKTDPVHTKQVNQRGGYTAIDPQYQLMKATEEFGSYGDGFGLESSDFDFTMYEVDGLVLHKAVFFYRINGEKVSFPISNAIQAFTNTKNGKRLDPDFAKKVETNTVSKALSKIGFNADIFMGLYEDNNYVNEVSNDFALEKAEDKEAEQKRQYEETVEWTKKQIEVMQQCKSANQYMPIYSQVIRRLNTKGYTNLIKRVDDIKNELEQKQSD